MTVLTMTTEKKSITLFNSNEKLNLHIRGGEDQKLDAILVLTRDEATELISWLQTFRSNLSVSPPSNVM